MAAAASAALLLGFGETLFLHATTAEVYAPNLLAVVGLITMGLIVLETGSARVLRAAAVLTGLMAGLHVSFVFVAAIVWLAALLKRRATLGVDLVACGLLGVAGALVLAYLPIRAATDPWRNWGDPSTLAALWDHLSGGRIRRAYASAMGGAAPFDVNLFTAALQLGRQLSWAGIVGVVGIVLLCLRRRSAGLLLFGVWGVDLLFTTLVNPMGMADRQTGLITTFAAVVAIGYGGAVIGRRFVTRHFSAYFAGALVVLAILGLGMPAIVAGGAARNLRELHQPLDAGEVALDHAAPSSLFLVSGDDLASALTFLQGVENRRPDCPTLVKQHALDLQYVDQLRAVHGTEQLTDRFRAAVAGGATPEQALTVLLEDNRERRPVFWELGDSRLDRMVYGELRADLPMGRLFGPRIRNLQAWLIMQRLRWRRLSPADWPGSALEALAHRYSLLSVQFARVGNRDRAMLCAQEAYMMSPNDPRVVNNYAMMLQLAGRQRQAEGRFRKVVTLRPGYALGWFNLGTSLFNRNERGKAATAFAESARLDANESRSSRMAFYMAILEANAGHLDRAFLVAHAAEAVAKGQVKRDLSALLDDLQARVLPP